MKIIEIGTGYTPIPAQISAATEIVVEKLTTAFIDLGEEVELVDIMAEDRKENALPISEVKVPKMFRKTDVQLGVFHKLKRVVYSVLLAMKLRKVIRENENNCVLHFHNQYNLFMFLLFVSKRIRKKAIIAYTNHSGIWNQPWKNIEHVVKKKYFQELLSVKKADKLFLLNEKTKQNVIKYLNVDPKKIHIIGNGVDIDVFRPLGEENILKIKHEYGLEGKKILLQVGSVVENKGQLSVIEALNNVFKTHNDFVYIYAGNIVSAEYQARIQNHISDNGLQEKVYYLGTFKPGKDLNELYNISDATIIASGYEAFPLVTIESMAAGTPVFFNNSVSFEKGNGCNYYTLECLPELIENSFFENSIKREQKQIARIYAEQNYAWKQIAKRYLQGLKQIG
ncbi:MAG: glycosyltransferase family 4 protein [Clostridia bacterium]|nr:glycosyltransferase family 4 protein [Clostridia bacterium]